MMHQKALLFGDLRTAELIMQSNCPKEQKRLGRTVSGFNQAVWNKYSMAVVRQENYHKINQTPGLIKILQTTMGTTLVEASPHDYFWGIDSRETDPPSQHRETWLGENKLGQILTELRDNIFCKFKDLATINFNLEPIKDRKQEHQPKKDYIVKKIGPAYVTGPNKPENERFTFFNGVESIYHINYIADFKIADVTYNSVQQYRQYSKARPFDDHDRASQIINATNTDEQRKLGSKVRHFNKDVWSDTTDLLMEKGKL